MTLNFERLNSIEATRDFLHDLLDPKKTPRVPKEIRHRARCVLKHFPTEMDMEDASKRLPKVFGKDYKDSYGGSETTYTNKKRKKK
jgi:hypothetical protein